MQWFCGIVNIIYKKEKQNRANGDIGLSFGLGAIRSATCTQNDLGSFSVNPKTIPVINLKL